MMLQREWIWQSINLIFRKAEANPGTRRFANYSTRWKFSCGVEAHYTTSVEFASKHEAAHHILNINGTEEQGSNCYKKTARRVNRNSNVLPQPNKTQSFATPSTQITASEGQCRSYDWDGTFNISLHVKHFHSFS